MVQQYISHGPETPHIFVYNPTHKKLHSVAPRQLTFLKPDRYILGSTVGATATQNTLTLRADVVRSRLIVFPDACTGYSFWSSAYRPIEEAQLTSLMCHLNKTVSIDEDASWKPSGRKWAQGNKFLQVSDRQQLQLDQIILYTCGRWFMGQPDRHRLFIAGGFRPPVGYACLVTHAGYSSEFADDVNQLMGYLCEKFPANAPVFCVTARQKFVVFCDVAQKYWSRVVVPYITNMRERLNVHWATRVNPNSLPEQGRRDIVMLVSWRKYEDERIRKQISWDRLIGDNR